MKRLLSLLLCALLICNFVLPAYAVDGENSESSQNETVNATNTDSNSGNEEGNNNNTSSEQGLSNQESNKQNLDEQDPSKQEAGGQNSDEQNSSAQGSDNNDPDVQGSDDDTIDDNTTEGNPNKDSEQTAVCNCGALDGEQHAESCPLYEPLYEEEEEEESSPVCICGMPDGVYHVKGCPLYTEPVCTCGAGESDDHAEDCPLYVPGFEIVKPSKNYSNVAPFLDPVAGLSPRSFSLFSLPTAKNTDKTDVEGLETSKTAKDNGDGSYTIRIESYVTGSTVTSNTEKEVPTDIILVLDQSGSMDDPFYNYVFSEYSIHTNSNYYKNRSNLWYELGDGSYSQVSVSYEYVVDTTYQEFTGTTFKNFYDNQNNLYQLIDGKYQSIQVSRTSNFGTYTVTFADGTEVQGNRNDSVSLSGRLIYQGTNSYDVQYTYSYKNYTGETVSFTSTGDSTDTEVVLYSRSQVSAGTRLSVLKNAVTTFVDEVHTKALGADGLENTDDDINHRIAVVGFGRADYGNDPYLNTELFIGSETFSYKNGLAAEHYYEALQDMNTEDGYKNVIASKEKLDGEGGTYIDLGIEMANGIFEKNPVEPNKERNRVVIIFTDGAPGYNGTYSGAEYGNQGDAAAVADEAIKNISITKNNYGATVYTVGIFTGADATSAGSNASNASAEDRANWLMQNLSSNNGTVPTAPNPSYYLSASDADTLNSIFKKISEQIQSGNASIELGSSTVVQDVVSKYFRIPDGTDSIDVYTADYQKDKTWAADIEQNYTISIGDDQKTVSVTGFDFSKNYVDLEAENGRTEDDVSQSGDFYGRKLILEITVVPEYGFLGGSGVPTNDSDSGIYNDSGLVEEFDCPSVNVTIPDISVTATEKNVYLFASLNEDQLLFGSTATYGSNSQYNLADIYARANDADTSNDPWEDDFVIITRTLSPGSFTDLTADTQYSLTYTVTDSGDSVNYKSDSVEHLAVNVFKPVVTWQDTVVEIGEVVNFKADNTTAKQNYVSTVWKHGDTVADSSMGDAPTLTFTYDQLSGIDYSEETKVDVLTVTLGGHEILAIQNPLISFEHVNCDFENCSWDDELDNGLDGAEFIIHINAFDLTINKLGVNEDLDPDAPFIFNISGNGIDMNVVIYGNGSVTIKDIPAGDYTVTEVGGYWRYSLDSCDRENGLVNAKNSTITFTNVRDEVKWLDNVTNATNDFDSVTNHVSPSNND